jgi:hypothetical protein
MKVRHKYNCEFGVAEGHALDGRILVRWDNPATFLNFRQHSRNLVFIMPARRRKISQLDAWKVYGMAHPADIKPEPTSNAYKQAARLYRVLCEKHYPGMPECNMKPLPTLAGVIDQIDHITTGLERPITWQYVEPA